MTMYCSLLIVLVFLCGVYGYTPAFDLDLYERVLDEEACTRQLNILVNDSLNFQFIDASGRIPSGLVTGNLYSYGNYYQCLEISQTIRGELIEGKYSGITFSFDQNPIVIPELPEWPEWLSPEDIPSYSIQNKDSRKLLQLYPRLQQALRLLVGIDPLDPGYKDTHARRSSESLGEASGLSLFLGICIPKPCTASQAIDFYVNSNPLVNLTIEGEYYRLPNDRPFAPADFVAFVIFAILICVTLASTGYDLYCTFSADCKPSKILSCFSIYTNTRRLLTFNSSPGALECVDGIRAISMMWVVIGHSFSTTVSFPIQNLLDAYEWYTQFSSTWFTSAPLSVDTFFLLSGILVVYTTIGKINRDGFLKVIHLFYINRLLRMFPLLAAMILIQASILNHVSDGPYWQPAGVAVENCRTYWWSALLHIQNYYGSINNICLTQSWYLAVDTQLYIFSPVVLVWLFGSRAIAWIVLAATVIVSLVPPSIYSFTYNFSAAIVNLGRSDQQLDYMTKYYANTLTRAPPFFVGMVFGYLLHQCRGKKVNMQKPIAIGCWIVCFILMAFCIFSIYPVTQIDWDGQMFDNFLNAYMRSLWALSIGWVIFACVHGYGGPVNWFLSLQMWKLPARLSFAMYLVHMSIMYVVNSSWMTPHYFTEAAIIYRFMADLSVTLVASFILCITIDAPFSTIQKQLLSRGGKPKPKENMEPKPKKSIDEEKTS